MDAFETLIAALLSREGYWTTTCYPVELTKEDKRKIGRPSSPRWELDVVAYSPKRNEILAVECKSYLDSRGVKYATISGQKESTRYKLFREEALRKTVLSRLRRQLAEHGLCLPKAKVRLALAAGKIGGDSDRQNLKSYFGRHRWRLFDEEWICQRLTKFDSESYANDVAMVVAKLLLRKRNSRWVITENSRT